MKRWVLIILVPVCALLLGLGVSADGPQAWDTPVSFDFADAGIRQVFAALAKMGNMNLLVTDAVAGRVTFSLQEVPLGKAIDLVARAAGVDYVVEDNTLIVGDHSNQQLSFMDADLIQVLQALAELGQFNVMVDESVSTRKVNAIWHDADPREAVSLLAETYDLAVEWRGNTALVSSGSELESDSRMEAIAPEVRLYSINYADPQEVQTVAQMVADGVKIKSGGDSRRLAVLGTEAEQEQVERVVSAIDRPPAQVFIEARVQEVSRRTMRSLGIDWGEAGYLEGGSAFGKLTLTAKELELVLEILEERGYSRLLATPQITTISGESASIFIGDRVPVILSGGEGTQDTIEYIQAGITLEITPQIAADGTITTKVRPEVASITGYTAQEIPQIRTRQAETTVRVRDGQPIVIGGLIKQEERDDMQAIPFLNQVPILNRLFGKSRSEGDQMETVIFLIPHLVNDQGGISGSSAREWAGSRKERLNDLMQELAPPAAADALKLEVTGLDEGSVAVELERYTGEYTGAYSKLGIGPIGKDGQQMGWSVGLGGRAYYRRTRLPFWAGIGIESVWLSDSGANDFSQPRAFLVTEVGLSKEGSGLFLEPHLRWRFSLEADEDESSEGEARVFGVKAGYRF